MRVNKNGYRYYFSYPLDILYEQLKKDEQKIEAYEIANKKLREVNQKLIEFGGLSEDVERTKEAIKLLEAKL